MTDWILRLILAVLDAMTPHVGTGALYEDGSPVIEPCVNQLDAAYFILRMAKYVLEGGDFAWMLQNIAAMCAG